MTYTVYLNDQALPVHAARTSREPINRVWPGKQRDIQQTEISYFVTFDMAAPVRLRIETSDDIERFALRPREFGIKHKISKRCIEIDLAHPRLFTIEVNGHHEALCVFANEPFTYKITDNTLYFGPGEHHVGMLYPKDGQTIILDEGATVYGGIYAYKVNDLTICGRGILDSSELLRGDELIERGDRLANELMELGLTERDVRYCCAFNAYACNNLSVDGIILRDPPFWAFTLRNGCRNVNLNNIKLIGLWRYNADGFDLCNCYDTTLSNCFVRSFDDCVVVRAPYLDGEEGGCKNVTVANNVLWCDWGKNLEIWAGNIDAAITDVVFRDNYLIHSCHIGVSIDTWMGSEHITVDGVTYENIYIDTSSDPLYPVFESNEAPPVIAEEIPLQAVRIQVGRLGKHVGNQKILPIIDTSPFTIVYKNIHLRNVRCTGEFKAPMTVNDSKLTLAENIVFTDCE
jgi:hypothetical protein